jgi:multidrug resistance efflux pump
VKVRDALAKQLRQAELNYQLAQSGLDRALGARRANTIGFATLEIQLADAQEQLEQAVAAQQAYGVTLDTLAAEIEAARLNLESLRSWENPYQDKATEEEIAQAEARLRQAEMAVAKLELQAGDAELDAPFAGTVVDVRVEPGDLVNPGQVVVLLAALDQLQARTVDLTELDIARVSLGQPVAVRVDALPDRELAGTVSEIGLQGKDYRGDVVYDVKIELVDAEAPEVLRWGMTAMVEIAAN